jgi:hypothetical protein
MFIFILADDDELNFDILWNYEINNYHVKIEIYQLTENNFPEQNDKDKTNCSWNSLF